MKDIRRISVLVLGILCAVFSYADKSPVTHYFNTMFPSAGLSVSADSKTGTTSLLTYTCTDGATFGYDLVYKTIVSINFPSKGATMTTTAVDSLARVIVEYYFSDSSPLIELRLSRDSTHWTDPLTPDVTVSTNPGYAEYNFVPGKYYIRLTSNNKKAASIFQLSYSFGWCNCFLYIPE